jgi:hypothetical protein
VENSTVLKNYFLQGAAADGSHDAQFLHGGVVPEGIQLLKMKA